MGTKDANLNFVFTVVDKSLLQKVIDTAQALVDNGELEGVVPSVQEKFEDALAAAEEINGKLDVTQEEIDNAWSELLDAIHLLSFELGDTTVLESLLEVAGSLAEEDFTADSWAALEEAVAAAEAVVSEEEPLKADVEEAEKDLYEALTNLVQVADFSQLQFLIEKAEEIAPYWRKNMCRTRLLLQHSRRRWKTPRL